MTGAVTTDRSDAIRRDLRDLEPSATLAINERSTALERAGRKIYRLGFGQSPFPVPGSVIRALREHASEKGYLAVQGLPELRQAVAEHHWRHDAVEIRAEDVLVGPGSKELIFLTQLAAGGRTLIPSPAWVSYAPQAKLLGRKPLAVATTFEDGWKMVPERLEAAIAEADASTAADERRTARHLLILNYPQNPVGNTYSAHELAALATVARRYRLLVIADEIYGRLHFSGGHASLARFYPEGTIISSGLSKWCGAGGWRLGTFALPSQLEDLRRTLAAAASETFTSVAAPIQHAAVTAFRGSPEIDRYLADSRRILRALGMECWRRLHAGRVRIVRPEGGFYLFPDFSSHAAKLHRLGIHDNVRLAARLLEDTGVAVLPGLPFGRPPEELVVRLSFVHFDGAQALDLAARLPPDSPLPEDFLKSTCGGVLEAIDRIVRWLH